MALRCARGHFAARGGLFMQSAGTSPRVRGFHAGRHRRTAVPSAARQYNTLAHRRFALIFQDENNNFPRIA